MDLDAQFAGGYDDQCARGAGEFGCAGGDSVQEGHAEGECLAHAGAGLTDEVVAAQGEGEGQFLDGEGVFDALSASARTISSRTPELGE